MTYSKHRNQSMCEAVAYTNLKTVENSKTANCHLKKRFHLSGFNWENGGILDGSHVEVNSLWYIGLRRLSHDAITWSCSSLLFVFTYKAEALRWMKRIRRREKKKGKTKSEWKKMKTGDLDIIDFFHVHFTHLQCSCMRYVGRNATALSSAWSNILRAVTLCCHQL